MIEDQKPTCENKMGFDTSAEAQNAATVAAHQRGSKLKIYKCQVCDLWHLATNYGEQHDY